MMGLKRAGDVMGRDSIKGVKFINGYFVSVFPDGR